MPFTKLRPRYNHWLPNLVNASAITLYPYIFFTYDYANAFRSRTCHHEMIHVRQVRQLGWLAFYASYVWQWLRGKKSYSEDAEKMITFEAQAYKEAQTVALTPLEMAELKP